MTFKKGDKVYFQDELFEVYHATELDVLIQNDERRLIVHPLTVRKADVR